jgi:hypothetical protein
VNVQRCAVARWDRRFHQPQGASGVDRTGQHSVATRRDVERPRRRDVSAHEGLVSIVAQAAEDRCPPRDGTLRT